MSFLTGLLRRELPPAPSAAGAVAGTTSALAVVPRLASRFESPGTPWWPGSGEQDSSGGGRESTDLERLEERDAKESLRSGTQASEAPITGNPALPSERQDGTDRLEEPPQSRAARSWKVDEASAPHSSVVEGNPHRGEGSNSVRPAVVAALSMPVSLPAVFSDAESLDAATASAVPMLAQATAEDGAGRLGRVSGVVHGLEGTGESSPAAHSHGDGRAVWQGSTEGQLRPRLEPLARREAARAPEQHIHVSIGRIEVRAVAAPAPQTPARERAGLMGLDEYLRDRS